MKKKFIVLYSVILSFLFVSCDYGWSEFFGRGDEVNERSSQMIDLDSISIAPSVDNSPTYSVVLFSDMRSSWFRCRGSAPPGSQPAAGPDRSRLSAA